jgi:glycosyltransferase involved in cell wall biosynthesis
MRVLFVKPSLAWPRTTGHDVYCYYMMKGLAELGVEVALATSEPTSSEATSGFTPAFVTELDRAPVPETVTVAPLSWLQERFRSFWGIEHRDIRAVAGLVDRWRPDVVVAFSLSALPYLAAVRGPLRVWAMADEWVYHHMAQVRLTDRSTWEHARAGIIKGAYERAYRSLVDRIWVVSETDRWAARYFAGMRQADLLPNGVDTEFFSPMDVAVEPETAIFWGSLLFEPNIDAMRWFCAEVWPEVKRRVPRATFTMMGYQPTPVVHALAGSNGISLLPNVPDIRPEVCRRSVVVLPFLSGGGIKNKLLEGAAMGRPILSTRHACRDLTFDGPTPIAMADSPAEWADALVSLWNDPARCAALGRDARAWVVRHYSWATPALGALKGFEAGLAAKRRS